MIQVGNKVKIINGRWIGQQGIVKQVIDNYHCIIELSNNRVTDIKLDINEIIPLIECDNDNLDVIRLKDELNAAVDDWRLRIALIKELQFYDCQRAKDILARLVNKDPVYHVREAAYSACKVLRVKRGHGLINIKKKPPRCIYDNGIMNKLRHVHNTLEGKYDQKIFAETFKKMYPVEYDVYEGYEDRFDAWLKARIMDIADGKTNYVRKLHIKGKNCSKGKSPCKSQI